MKDLIPVLLANDALQLVLIPTVVYFANRIGITNKLKELVAKAEPTYTVLEEKVEAAMNVFERADYTVKAAALEIKQMGDDGELDPDEASTIIEYLPTVRKALTKAFDNE